MNIFCYKLLMKLKKKARLTLMNNSMLGSLSEFCRSAMSSPKNCFIHFFLKKCPSSWSSQSLSLIKLRGVFLCNLPKNIHGAGGKADNSVLEQAALVLSVSVVVDVRRKCDTSGLVVFCLLGGYRSEHTSQVSREKREGSREWAGCTHTHTRLYTPSQNL